MSEDTKTAAGVGGTTETYIVRVLVCTDVEVSIDPSKFDAAFLKEFERQFFPFNDVKDHVQHLAQLFARGAASHWAFIEGYGMPMNMGIRLEEIDLSVETEIIEAGNPS